MTNNKIIKNRLGLLELAKELGNVSQACRYFGYSRDTFYRYKESFEADGKEGLLDLTRRGRPNFKNRIAPEVEARIVELAVEQPAWGQTRMKNELLREGIGISATGVRGIWMRHGLETFKKRLKALEEKAAAENLVLTEAQVAALEEAKREQDACGEIETEHPGYLGAQDTFYVGTLKGVGRIYQQTFIDTYSKVALAKLYPMRTALAAADMINDQVMPFFEQQQVPVLRVLTDRGAEYCGNIEKHEYQLILALENIDHSRTKARHPQTNGIAERFHKTILSEFYKVTFRKKIYRTLEELQADLDRWLSEYNTERTHQGKHCNGRTPMQTFLEDKKLALEKQLGDTSQHLTEANDDASVTTHLTASM